MEHRKKILIYGGRGALGGACVAYFKLRNWWVCNVDLFANDEADANVILKTEYTIQDQALHTEDEVAKCLNNDRLAAILCVAGGWAGGNAASNSFIQNCDLVWRQSVWSSLIAAQLASKHLAETGLLQLTGAKAALDPCPGMIGYAMAKSAVHSLALSLAAPKSGVPQTATVLALLPITLDTPANRSAMPDADHSTWTPLDFVAKLCISSLAVKSPLPTKNVSESGAVFITRCLQNVAGSCRALVCDYISMCSSSAALPMLPAYDDVAAATASHASTPPPCYFEAVTSHATFKSFGLTFIDFWPTANMKLFTDLIACCNTWLAGHVDVEAVSLESIDYRWASALNDRTMTFESLAPNGSRGLRMWVACRQNKQQISIQEIGYVCLVPTHKRPSHAKVNEVCFESFSSLVSRLNAFISSPWLLGRILSVEVSHLILGDACQLSVDANSTFSHNARNAFETKQHSVNILRIYFTKGLPAFEQIEFVNFVPKDLSTKSAELYSELLRRADAWIRENVSGNLHLISLQTDFRHLKSKSFVDLESCCTIESRSKTLLSCFVLRVWLSRSQTAFQPPLQCHLSCITFIPKRASRCSITLDNHREYETSDALKLRLSTFMQLYEARIVCAETVAIRMYDRQVRQHCDWQERTIVSKNLCENQCWIHMIRLFVYGFPSVEDDAAANVNANDMMDSFGLHEHLSQFHAEDLSPKKSSCSIC